MATNLVQVSLSLFKYNLYSSSSAPCVCWCAARKLGMCHTMWWCLGVKADRRSLPPACATEPGRRRALVLPKPKQSADSSFSSSKSSAEAAAAAAEAPVAPAVTKSVRIRLLVCGTRFVVAAVHSKGCISWGGCFSYETAQRPCRHALCAHCSSCSSCSSSSSSSSSSTSDSSSVNLGGKCAPNWVQGLQDADVRHIAAGTHHR
jgi:hypothetical protein